MKPRTFSVTKFRLAVFSYFFDLHAAYGRTGYNLARRHNAESNDPYPEHIIHMARKTRYYERVTGYWYKRAMGDFDDPYVLDDPTILL